MRGLQLGAVLLGLGIAACGDPAELELVVAGSSRSELLPAGASADGVIAQSSGRGRKIARTDAASLARPLGVASTSQGGLWVADASNARVLGYENAASLENGAAATVVINQGDFETTSYLNVPALQRVTPSFLMVDPEDRLYVVTSTDRVLVFENPFAHDVLADYELVGVPAGIRTVRSLSNGTPRVIVVGQGGIVFYPRGSPDPLRTAPVLSGTACGNFQDAAEVTGALLLACNGSVWCGDATYSCGGILVYATDQDTGFIVDTGQPFYAYRGTPNGAGIDVRIAVEGSKLFILEISRHRIVTFASPGTWVASLVTAGVPQALQPKVSPSLAGPGDYESVFGQADAAQVSANRNATYSSGESKSAANSLSSPSGLAFSPQNHLWVADTANHRVLRFNAGTGSQSVDLVTADGVLGQPSFLSWYENRLEAGSLVDPGGVALFDAATGVRAYVVDTTAHRVLAYSDVRSLQNGADPDFMLGQSLSGVDPPYLRNGGSATPTASGLNGPTRVAVSPTGVVFVADTGNNTVLAYENLAGGTYTATRAYGANSVGAYGTAYTVGPKALAASTTHLYVADGNRVLAFQIATTGSSSIERPIEYLSTPGYTTWVFGQPNSLTNTCSFGGIGPDSLCSVTGLAVAPDDSRLWIADSANDRVLWFDDPVNTQDYSAAEATTADGVVGQRDFVSQGAYAGLGAGGHRYGFSNNGLSDIALDGDGVLWASDSGAHRVLGFADPTAPDGPNGMPVATTVLGQASFSTFTAATDDTVSLRNLAGPVAVGVNSAGNALLVSDGGNHRVLRYVDNLPPRISGAGDFDVELGATRTVQLNITDPEGTAVALAFVEVDRPTGASLAGTSVTYVATDPDLRVGDTVGFPLVATDAGLPPKSTSVSVNFKIVPQTVSPARAPTIRRAVAAPERGGCGCSASSGAALPWLAALVLLEVSVKRRRRT